MRIYQVNNKRDYVRLLLLADEQENMIEKYLDRGTMYVLNDNGVKAEIVVCDEGNGVLEIKNLAVEPHSSDKAMVKGWLISFVSITRKNIILYKLVRETVR